MVLSHVFYRSSLPIKVFGISILSSHLKFLGAKKRFAFVCVSMFRAFSLDKLGKYEDAYEDYTRAIEIQPKNSNAYHNRGNIGERLKRFDDAIADFTKAIELGEPACSSRHARYEVAT